MSTTIVMPKAGLTMVEGTISRWPVTEGAHVKKGDALMEYENEKNTIECDALADGYVHILAQEGDTIPVGEPIGILAESPEELAALSGTTAPAEAPATSAAPAAATQAEGVAEIPMPRAGLTMVEGTIAQWKVSEGAEVAKGDVVMEFENEKNTIDDEIIHGGFLHIVAAEGETVKVGDPIAYVAESKAAYDALVSGGAAPASSVEKGCARECPTCVHTAAAAAAVPAVSSAVRTDGHIRASGLAKKMAKEAGIDIRAVSPSGGDGTRIIARDITAYLEARKNAPAPAAVSIGIEDEITEIPWVGVKKTIARNMMNSLQTMAQNTCTLEVDLSLIHISEPTRP